ncbi:unnamed protein product, partial [Vitis vinifera]|uniref:Uncharacterized protein n=1 Tax=Vitis vinifera TaxID=29760 RepID=E0CQU5_VITVI
MEMNAGKSNDSLPAVSRKGLAGRPIVKMNNPMQEASKKENPRKVMGTSSATSLQLVRSSF